MFRVSGRVKTRGIIIFAILLVFALAGTVSASTPAIRVEVIEYLTQTVAYDQSLGENNVISDARGELGENKTGTSRTGVELSDLFVYGMINISNVETLGGQTLVSINVTLNGTDNISHISLASGAPDYLVYNLSEGEDPVLEPRITIFIPELRAGDSAIFDFNISGAGLGEPVNFTEEYSSWRMLTGQSTHITLNVTNSFPTPVTFSNLVITKTPEGFPSSDGGLEYFRFTDLSGDDSGNATIFDDISGRTILQWNASDGDLSPGETRQIEFNAWAPENISVSWENYEDWGVWLRMGNISSTFGFNGSMSGLEIESVVGVSPALRYAISKDRVNETHWNATVNMTNDASAALDYELSHVSIWATRNLMVRDPADQDNWINNTNVTTTGVSGFSGPYANYTWWPRINLSNGTSNTNYSILFNYSLVPIVWAHANFMILDDGTQIFKLNRTEAIEDGYFFIEEIYVLLGGYLMKVTKLITPLENPTIDNLYEVNVTIENVGKERSPELITMFDLVPKGFMPLNYLTNATMSNRTMYRPEVLYVTNRNGLYRPVFATVGDSIWGGSDTGEVSGGPYSGYWGYHLDMMALNSSSDGDGYYDASLSYSEVGVRYKIVGNTTISSVENAYLIGVDPIRLEGGNPSKSVMSIFDLWSRSWEPVIIISSILLSSSLLVVGIKYLGNINAEKKGDKSSKNHSKKNKKRRKR
ncbi:MAG: hypothetical protein ACLFPQ_05530 [Candidatus Woesearchaeota archaeon]